MGLGSNITAYLANIYLGKNLLSLRKYFNHTFKSKSDLLFFCCLEDPYSYLLAQILPKVLKTYKLNLILVPISVPGEESRPSSKLQDNYGINDCILLAKYHQLHFPIEFTDLNQQDLEQAKRLILGSPDIQNYIDLGKRLWNKQTISKQPPLTSEFTNFKLKENLKELNKKGHYLGATLLYQGEWFWGLDRIPFLINLLNQTLKKSYILENFLKRAKTLPPQKTVNEVDFYFSFRSPYSYIALHRLERLKETFNFKINYKPILPMVMRGLPVPNAKKIYIVNDANRVAKSLNIPFGKICDPVGKGIQNTLALWPLVIKENKESEFLFSFFNGIWSEGADVSNVKTIKILLKRCGLSWQEGKELLKVPTLSKGIEINRQRLFEEGLWGVPSFKVNDHCFWGQDRIKYFKDLLAPK